MDQRRDRRRAFHRVRQPHVQGQLGRLAHRPHEEEQAHQRQRAPSVLGVKSAGIEGRADLGEFQGAQGAEGEQHAEDEPSVPHAIDDERLVGCIGSGLLAKVEPDQAEAAESDSLPADEQQRVVVPQHQHQHEEQEQVEEPEESVVAAVVSHVAGGVDMDQESDPGHHQHHDGAQRIQQEAPVRRESPQAGAGC